MIPAPVLIPVSLLVDDASTVHIPFIPAPTPVSQRLEPHKVDYSRFLGRTDYPELLFPESGRFPSGRQGITTQNKPRSMPEPR